MGKNKGKDAGKALTEDLELSFPEIHFPDTIELDDDIDFSVADFSIVDEEEQTRIIKPKMAKSAIYNKADFQYARDLASQISLEKNTRTTCIVPGNFIFGDLPEALVMYRGIDLKTIYCSTLSLSENNVDSFKNLLLFRNVEKINLMLSGYFYSHYKTDLIPYLYEELDIDNKLQVAFTNTHMKILLMETHKGNHYVLTGSANLRSASCLEQFDFEENEELFNFYREAFDNLIDKYKTIDFGACRVRRIPGLLHLSGHARSAEHILPLHEALACGLLAIIRHQGNPYNLLGKQKDVQLVF